MKLSIKNTTFVIAARMISKLLWAIVWFAVAFVAMIIIVPKDANSSQIFLGFSLTLIPPILYLVVVAIDAYMYAKSATIEIAENTVNLHANNLFSRSNNSLPISQINQANVIQTFIFKLFGVSAVVFSDESGSTNILWGFNYEDAANFLNEFGSRYKIKISK